MDEVLEKLRIPLQNIKRLTEHLITQGDFRCWHEPDTGVLCFQHQPDHVPEDHRNDLQTFIYETILREGKRSISVTQLGDAIVLRILVISPNIHYDDLIETITDIRSIGAGFTIENQTR